MKRAAHTDSTGSFDLFLDTICNTFGGIVFLAILVTLMVQSRSIVASQKKSNQETVSPVEVVELLAELDVAKADHADIERANASLPEAADGTDENAELYRLRKRKKELENQITSAVISRTRLARELAETTAQSQSIADNNQSVARSFEALNQQLREIKSQFSTSLRSKETELRLARERRSDSIAWVVLIDQRRVYAAARGAVPLHLLGSDQVECTSTGLRTCTLATKPGTGWSIASKEFRGFLVDARRSGVEIMVAVWPNSYGYFRGVKQQLIENDLRYSLYPMQQNEDFGLVSGGGRTVQ